MKVEKGEFLLDDVNSVMTTMRRAELSAYWAALNVSFSKHRYTPLPAPRTGQRLNFATGLNVQTKLAKYRRMTAACGVTVGRWCVQDRLTCRDLVEACVAITVGRWQSSLSGLQTGSRGRSNDSDVGRSLHTTESLMRQWFASQTANGDRRFLRVQPLQDYISNNGQNSSTKKLPVQIINCYILGILRTKRGGRKLKWFHNSLIKVFLPSELIGSRTSDHYFRSVCWFVCFFVQSFSQPSLIRFRSN